jgi:hypothetical protein
MFLERGAHGAIDVVVGGDIRHAHATYFSGDFGMEFDDFHD